MICANDFFEFAADHFHQEQIARPLSKGSHQTVEDIQVKFFIIASCDQFVHPGLIDGTYDHNQSQECLQTVTQVLVAISCGWVRSALTSKSITFFS